MIELLAVVLENIGTAFLAALAGRVTDEVWTKIKSDAAKKAIKQAIGAAIQRYATSGLRLDLARPLLEKDGFLTMPAVAGELTQLVRFEREPNAVLIGQQWKASMDDPPLWCDFTYEANRLLEYLRVELRSTEIFRPVFDAKSLDALVVSAATSIESLTPVETQLADLAALADNRFSDLARTFAGSSLSLREQIRDYTRFIEEKTRDFVGREFVFDAVNHFTDTHSRGYFFIRGDPGVGKTALAAQMVRVNGYVHHFNIRSEGINTAELFLRNICAQLIAVYQLNYTSLPDEATQDGRFLSQLLEEVSGKLEVGEKAIIVVDALDQVDTSRSLLSSNPLYLPLTLPQGMYIIVTMRKVPLALRLECEQATLDIEHDSAANIADIHNYVERATARPGIQAYIATQGMDTESFTELLVQKSGGNFMYLHYLLPEIERGSSKELSLGVLPTGLSNYYEDQWRRIRGRDEEDWFKYKLPIIMALTVVKEPISIDLIADFSGVRERTRIREVLSEWAPFLHEEQVIFEGSLQRRYHIYHPSFQDFITRKEEVEDERVSLRQAHKKIADTLWEELFGE